MRKIDYYCLPITEKEEISFFVKNASREAIKELLLFDFQNKKFINENEEVAEIKEKVILVKSTTKSAHVLMKNIESAGGKFVVLTTIGDLQDNIEIYEELLGNRLLVSALHKELDLIYNVREWTENGQKYKFLRDTHGHGVRFHFRDSEIPILVCSESISSFE